MAEASIRSWPVITFIASGHGRDAPMDKTDLQIGYQENYYIYSNHRGSASANLRQFRSSRFAAVDVAIV